MRLRSAISTAVACVLVLVAAVAVVAYQAGSAGQPVPTAATAPAEAADDMAILAELYQQLTEDAVDIPESETLLLGAIEGMLETLDDPYAVYFDPQAFRQFNLVLDGSFYGVGLMLEEQPEGPVVVNVLPDTPAERAGIEVGERIVSVDGRDVRHLPLRAIVNMVTGDEGTAVTIGFEEGPDGSREVELTRAEIEIPVVQSELLDDGVGYVELMTFSQTAAERLDAAVDDLLAQGAEGIVLDLRQNAGGLLNQAIDVASMFMPRGELVVTVREAGGEERPLRSRGGDHEELPIVVLVGPSSASASEILAGALQDMDRAEIVGEETFGKGTVQTVRNLADGSGVKFTTAEYFTPSGDSIEGTGITPDRRVAEGEDPIVAATGILRDLMAQLLSPAA